ncbi:phage tail protein [Kineosporia sp. J2-2]|uniref:Phage tail protein n=1 Tax=Kineosporia corallincola TaxID=2835133 RepID=A0ABS5TBK0_9ACTN|nr:phage tail protein [Kineosporia corallincola]MBT0768218.1 phage tail protein [Kineosporia corallincola]
MPNTLVSDTALISNAFYLEIDGAPLTMLISVSGLDISVEATDLRQTTATGQAVWTRTLGTKQKGGTLQMTRLAVVDTASDGIWKWFSDTSLKGSLEAARKNGSIVLYSSDGKELGRYNFTNGWISKIGLDQLDITSGNPLKESITLEIDLLERVK